jgi:hypothetical protein
MINFAKGYPDPRVLPHALLARGCEHVAASLRQQAVATPPAAPSQPLSSSDRTLLDYCPQRGAPEYRAKLASFINREANDGW